MSSLSAQRTYAIVSSGHKRAAVSIWLSVSSPDRNPWSSHNTCCTEKFQITPFAFLSHSPFLLGESRHSDVVSRVPLPSDSMEPPSRTKFNRLTYSPLNSLFFIDTAGNQIVEIGGEFQTPTVECEIENPVWPVSGV